MVARWGTAHPSAPLVVALHGNGTSEHSMIEIAPWLPHGPVAYVAVRGPITGDSGFHWYTETDGRPDPASLAASTAWFLDVARRPRATPIGPCCSWASARA